MNDSDALESLEKKYLEMTTKEFNNDFVSNLKTRVPVIYISTQEEKRLISYISSVGNSRGYEIVEWNCFRGFRKHPSNEKIETPSLDVRYAEPTLQFVIDQIEAQKNQRQNQNGVIYILCDFYRYLSTERCSPQVERQIKYLNRIVSNCHVIMTGPHYTYNTALEKEIAVLDFPFPNDKEIQKQLSLIVNSEKIKTVFPSINKIASENEENLVNAVKGLTLTEAEQAYTKSIIMAKQLGVDPLEIDLILKEKKDIIKKTDILEYVDSDISISDVGGLDGLINWLNIRKSAFSKDAIEYGLKPPKGLFLIGIPGCGKSLTAKAAAKHYNMPLLRLDFGKMFNSLVGESEKIARHAIKLAETIAPCVAGDSEVYDIDGNSYTVESLMTNLSLFADKDLYTFSFNEETYKIEKTKIKAVIKHKDKKKMLKIKTFSTDVKVTEDHKIMINENGELLWKEARNLKIGDAVVCPKYFSSINDKFSLSSSLNYVEHTRMNNSYSDTSFDEINLFKEDKEADSKFSFIVGMIEGKGYHDSGTGDVVVSLPTKIHAHIFSQLVSDLFSVEPKIQDNVVSFRNIIIARLITEFLMRFNQQNLALTSPYLAGFFYACGRIGINDFKGKLHPFMEFKVQTLASGRRVKNALHKLGILTYKYDDSHFFVVNKSEILVLSQAIRNFVRYSNA